MPTKILIATSTFSEVDRAPLEALLREGVEIITNPFKRKLTKDELLRLLPGVRGLIAGLEPLDREVLKQSELKVISRCGSGLSNVDLKAAKELGIIVRNTPLAPVTAVAEVTIGCLLALVRRIPFMDNALHKGDWTKITGRQLRGMNVAVIGFGHIGKRVGELLLSFGSTVSAVDPACSGRVGSIQIVGLDEALREADVVTLHCSGEDCVIGAREFGLMKAGSYILNAARGGLIDEAALIHALDSKRIAGAWLDTFLREPYTGPLSAYDNVLLTPHIGSYTAECRRDMEMEAVRNLLESLVSL